MPLRINCIKEENGFSLIEVMAGLVMLSLITVTLLGLFSTSSIWVTKGGQQTRASDYGVELLENIRAHAEKLPSLFEPPNLPPPYDAAKVSSFLGYMEIDPADLSSGLQDSITAISVEKKSDNLFQVTVDIKLSQNPTVKMSALIGAR